MPNPTQNIHPILLELFDEITLPETVRRTLHGLRQPKTTGEYKWARLQMRRLLSPLSAVIVPLLVILLVALLAKPQQDEQFIGTRLLPKPIAPPKLDEKPELIETTPPDLVFTPPAITVSTVSSTELAPPEPVRAPAPDHSIASISGVADIRCPVSMPGIYSSRAAVAGGGSGALTSGASAASERAVLNALRWLKSVQEEDGAWSLASGGGPVGKYSKGATPAMTGLALLAYLAHGETPNSEEFGPTVEKGLRWLQRAQESDGRFSGRDNHDYSHPIATFALCEAYGMTKNPLLAPVVSRAVQVIIDGQNPRGGWTYNCEPVPRNDLSYTGWCVQAIKAAKLANVPCDGLDEALNRSVSGLIANASPEGGFGYTSPGRSHLTAVGVLGLQLLGYKAPRHISRGLAVLQDATCKWDEPLGRNPIYYWYYITQAKRLAGGRHWELWNREFSSEMTGTQIVLAGAGEDGKDIGYWESASDAEHCKSRVYNTTLCTLSLEVYYKVGGFSEPPPEDNRGETEYKGDVPLTIVDV